MAAIKKTTHFQIRKNLDMSTENSNTKKPCIIDSVSKRDLGNHLAKVIEECSDGMGKLETGSRDWTWLASKKTLAESILIQFC